MADLNESDRMPTPAMLEDCGSGSVSQSGQTALSRSSSARDFATLTIPMLTPDMMVRSALMNEPSVVVLLAKLNASPYYNLALASLTKLNPVRVDVPTVCEFLRQLGASALVVAAAKKSRKKFTSQFHEQAFFAICASGHFDPHQFERATSKLDDAMILYDQLVCIGSSDFGTPRPTNSD
jgi:hypothetical protein